VASPSGAEALKMSRQQKFNDLFRGRRWRVQTEKSGPSVIGGIRVRYDCGEFWIDPPGVFQTPLGHKGRHGFVLIEVDADGRDVVPLRRIALGYAAIRGAAEHFGAIAGELPEPRSHPPLPPMPE